MDTITAINAFYLFSQAKFATVQEVLHADWQEFAHSLQPGFFKLASNDALFTVFICFIIIPLFINNALAIIFSAYNIASAIL